MKKAPTIWLSAAVVVIVGLTLLGVSLRRRLLKPLTITGAIIAQDADPRKQLPVGGVEITAANNLAEAPAKSDSSGFFSLPLRKGVGRDQEVTLMLRHPNYHPLDVAEFVRNQLYIVHLVPLSKSAESAPNPAAIAVANIRVRYSVKAMRTVNIGSAVKTFQVENVGNIACKGRPPCSPDGKWKAAISSVALDAGAGNEFQNVRVSCIAGPCPFTKIQSDEFSESAQKITASAENWSDTTTFLVEAEVVHTMQSPIDHESYPVIFGSALSFTLPAGAEGVSIETDVAGKPIIFPLGPNLFLDWASCSSSMNDNQTSVYRCELKPGYRFQ
jgi:hypothetical protein